MSDLASIIDFNDSLEVNRCSSQLDSSNSKKWMQELDEVSDIGKLLEEETFDFDLSVSPENGPSKSSKELLKLSDDEEEIFFGPVRYKEICVATNVTEEKKVAEKFKPLSPLTATEMAQLCQEAFTVSCRIRIATGTNDAAESALSPAATPSASSPALTFSPLDEVFSNLSKILPAEKQLSCDENGVVKFQGTQCKGPVSTTQTAERKLPGQSVSRLGLNSHQQSRLARGSFLQRSSALRRSGDSVQKLPVSIQQQNAPDSLSSCLFDNIKKCDGDEIAGRSPLMKRFCSIVQEAAELSDKLNVASEAADSHALNQLAGKKQLPAPKIKVSTASRLPHLSLLKPPQPVSTSSSATQFTDSILGGTDASKQVSSGIQRSSSMCLSRPIYQLPRAETKVPPTSCISDENNPQSASKVASSNMALIGTTAQRKILTAARSRPYGVGISQGPMKAVGPMKGTNTMVLAQDTAGFQMKHAPSAVQATPKKTSGARASIGGTTPGSVSRTHPVSGLPTPSKLKAPEISRPHYQ